MTDAEDIEKAIAQLAPRELARLRAWFEVFDADRFDAASERDAATGKLDGFAEEASRPVARVNPGTSEALQLGSVRTPITVD